MAEWVRASTGDRTVDGSSPISVNTFRLGTLAIPSTPLCQYLSDETVKAVGPFYLVSMLGIGVRANIHLGGQTEFCPNGEPQIVCSRPDSVGGGVAEIFRDLQIPTTFGGGGGG